MIIDVTEDKVFQSVWDTLANMVKKQIERDKPYVKTVLIIIYSSQMR